VKYDHTKAHVNPLYDYAVHPGDHLIVAEDPRRRSTTCSSRWPTRFAARADLDRVTERRCRTCLPRRGHARGPTSPPARAETPCGVRDASRSARLLGQAIFSRCDYFLRWRIRARMRRFLRPILRRPFLFSSFPQNRSQVAQFQPEDAPTQGLWQIRRPAFPKIPTNHCKADRNVARGRPRRVWPGFLARSEFARIRGPFVRPEFWRIRLIPAARISGQTPRDARAQTYSCTAGLMITSGTCARGGSRRSPRPSPQVFRLQHGGLALGADRHRTLLQDRRVDFSRIDVRHANAVGASSWRRPYSAHSWRISTHSRRSRPSQCPFAGDGRDIDDQAVPASSHLWQHEVHAVVRPGGVDSHHLVPLLGSHLGHRSRAQVRAGRMTRISICPTARWPTRIAFPRFVDWSRPRVTQQRRIPCHASVASRSLSSGVPRSQRGTAEPQTPGDPKPIPVPPRRPLRVVLQSHSSSVLSQLSNDLPQGPLGRFGLWQPAGNGYRVAVGRPFRAVPVGLERPT